MKSKKKSNERPAVALSQALKALGDGLKLGPTSVGYGNGLRIGPVALKYGLSVSLGIGMGVGLGVALLGRF